MAKIVIVDDSPADLKMMESILRSGNHQVASINDPLMVEELVAAHKPDLLMLDVVMPERNGYEVLRLLKRNPQTKDVPVILVSSKGNETDVRWGLRQGAQSYVTKPYTAQQVLENVQKVLG